MITKVIKLKELVSESTWKDRKFGEPLPTIEDYMKEKGDVGRGVDPDATDANIDKDLMDKQIVYRDKDTGEDKTISVRGALKQGEDHPAYDDAKKMVDKEKGGNDKEEPSGKLGAGDFERDSDDEYEEKVSDIQGKIADVVDTTAGDPDDAWDDEEGRAKPGGMGEITIDGKKYKPITENIEPTIFNPQEEIKKVWNKIKTRQFDRKWKKEII